MGGNNLPPQLGACEDGNSRVAVVAWLWLWLWLLYLLYLLYLRMVMVVFMMARVLAVRSGAMQYCGKTK